MKFLCVLLVVLLVCCVSIFGQPNKPAADDIRVTLDNMTVATLVDILEQQGIYIGDNYYSKDELIQLVLDLVDAQNARDAENTRYASMADNVDGEVAALPTKSSTRTTVHTDSTNSSKDDANNSHQLNVAKDKLSVWEQVKEQIKSDIAPFLLLVPQPVKTYIAREFPRLTSSLKVTLQGALTPMLFVAAKLVRKVGALLVLSAEKLDQLHSQTLATTGSSTDKHTQQDNQDKHKQQNEASQKKQRKAKLARTR